ncbi:hypothetical protein PHSY_003218 [Pseudozyma hubeiensis SY62]|uniref:Uncharacterized protein n=1 Tax=Pseudozyma hubeiensis (strain SY62) TaxID=1305764 RepID=R9P310_PSEHS|nr:hypothetical protein PHSY_003218 [Pseudozyma hubeiensis SY62]GAC95642.1 hypothetical protein PHSY_003218 [Pseudozyma hubeiensis SY62]
MQSGGGFIIDDLSTVFDFDDPNNRPTAQPHQPAAHEIDNDSHPPETVATPKPLTSKQEAKLRSYLDGALEDITRGYRKRFDPSSSLHTLTSYLGEWMRLLGVLAHVPPYGGGSTNLLVSYLLRCSTELSDGITGYSLAMEVEAMKRQRKRQKQDRVDETDTDGEEESDDEEEERQHQIASRTKQLNLALQTLDLVDRIWAAVLRGNLINLPVALTNARKAFPDTTETVSAQDQPPSHKSHIPRTVHSTTSLVPSPAIDGRFRSSDASSSSSSEPRESLPIHGGRANKTVGVTDQVRLRNIAISSRDKLFSWMRAELDAPAPPTMEDEEGEADEPSDNTVEGALGVRQGTDTVADGTGVDEEEEEEFEDVAIGADQLDDSKGYNGEQDTEERRHYQDLFDRKLDPDADDDDDDDDAPPTAHATDQQDDKSDQTLGASVLGTVEAVTSTDSNDKRKRPTSPAQTSSPRADGLPSKRRREASPDTETDAGGDARMSRSEMGSINFTLSDFGQWDVAFTRLFSKTLRTLSDLGEFSNRTARKEFSTSLAGISGADEQEAVE